MHTYTHRNDGVLRELLARCQRQEQNDKETVGESFAVLRKDIYHTVAYAGY